jgi:hypothetical protein
MKTHDVTDPEKPKIGYRDPRPPHRLLTVSEAFEQFKVECDGAAAYVGEVGAKILPMGPFAVQGHVVEEPVPPGGFLEDSYKPDWDPFAHRRRPTGR